MASSRPTAFETAPEREASGQRWAIKLDFVDSNPGVQPTGQDRTAATISYFKGSQDQWHTGLPTFARLMYADLWPGIDLVYAGTVDRLKYIFVVKPGADPAQIKLAYRGAKTVRLSDVGQLEVSTPVGSFVDDAPHAYQEVEGRRVKVATAYALHAGEAVQEGAQAYGFQVGVYDAGRPLVLDPAVLIYAGYVGGSGDDCGSGIAADSGGNA